MRGACPAAEPLVRGWIEFKTLREEQEPEKSKVSSSRKSNSLNFHFPSLKMLIYAEFLFI